MSSLTHGRSQCHFSCNVWEKSGIQVDDARLQQYQHTVDPLCMKITNCGIHMDSGSIYLPTNVVEILVCDENKKGKRVV